ncbi:uncharacterized protein C05D11.1-like isoform X2 [Adelges cooleyi]|uniref:uncharacterized protein C05D11.1-like isoform X2 n=1 Tax=Adelges cooleyi TaxID=133065 RepID=UPI0021806236|nr:uncharacterized protein C05D11.1-like isoform X2 [Adelges cooleyi]
MSASDVQLESCPVDVAINEMHGNKFALINCSLLENTIPVYKYKCKRTGITIVIGDIEGPVVNGYFTLATEAHDDDGLPHTLEHLIFLGSEDYPFKGVLDLVANRCLASGTNAWTDVDHTCYTVTTAGSEGFLSLLPIYLDHILYPTLKDAAFVTEVHHVTSEGKDGGVVYCEMQGRENSGESIINYDLLNRLYPGECGYKSATGGIMKNLRESTTNEKVRQYHHAFYRPENLLLLITGKIEHSALFTALEPTIMKILSKGNRGDYVRPWQTPVEPIEDSYNFANVFPCDEETNGLINVGYRGPDGADFMYKYLACELLLKYLTDTPISPLRKEFVEIADPYCSRVGFSMTAHMSPAIVIEFENVPVTKIDAWTIPVKLEEVLNKLASDEEYFDVDRLRVFIDRYKLALLTTLENSPHDMLAMLIIGDFLYGNTPADLEERLNRIRLLKQLYKEDILFWIEILETYFIDNKRVVARGSPSNKRRNDLAAEEHNRIAQRKAMLGEEGLKTKAIELLNAKNECERVPPKALLTSVKIPNINSIKFFSYDTYSTNSTLQHPSFLTTDVPLYVEADHVKSNFVYMYTFINTKDLPLNLRMYLPLIVDLITESTVVRNGVQVHYTDIIAELEKDLVNWKSEVGLGSPSWFLCGTYSSVFTLFLQLEPEKYERGVRWLNDFLYNTKITKEKFSVSVSKIANEVSSFRRHGDHMLKDLLRNMMYNKENNHYACSTLRQQTFLAGLQEKIETEEGWLSVTEDLSALKLALANPDNIKLHISANLNRLCEIKPRASAMLKRIIPSEATPTKQQFDTVDDYKYTLPVAQCVNRACIVGMGSIESSFFVQITDCINDFNHPDLPALLVFLQYFTQLEGPMWRKVRGLGYAYSYSISPKIHEGKIYLYFYRAVNIPAAYKATRTILEEHVLTNAPWDMALFESAKCATTFEIIDRESTVGDLISQSVLHHFRDMSQNYNQDLVKKIASVTIRELPKIGRKYVMPLFDPKVTVTAMVCQPSKIDDVAAEFKEMGIPVKVYQNLDESFLSDA